MGLWDATARRVRRGARTPARRLFRKIVVINGLVFACGTMILALSPASVSARIKLEEIPILAAGLALTLIANALLLRSSLAPLDRLAAAMRRVDPPWHSDRMDEWGDGDLHDLIASFHEMLDRLEAERGSARAATLSAQERERQRIARELHDEIGQSLTVALLRLKQAEDGVPAGARTHLRQVQEIVRGSLEEVRLIARRLRPDALDNLGLSSALRTLANEVACASGIDVEHHITSRKHHLAPDTELSVYRIAQESLTNVVRHSGADKAWLRVHTTTDELKLSVADNGDGGVEFHGVGLQGMLERALLINASLTITSPPGEGTVINLAVPLPSSSGAPQ